ncbi:MAG: glycosyltransferase, partial [Gaiellaceae bacterium]
MRIVHVIARLNMGGAALSVLELAAEQQRRGHEVVVVAGRIPAGEASMEHVADELGVPTLHLATMQREVAAASDLATVRALRRLLREQRPDVLHTHTAKAGTTGRIAALTAGRARPRAVVHTFHGHVLRGYFDPVRERVFRLIERGLARASDRLIAVSDEVRDDLVSFGVAPASKIAVIPYGFDLDARLTSDPEIRARKRREAGADKDTFVIGWAGRLTPIKQPLDLVRAAAGVNGSLLVLAGDGELRDEVVALAAALG